MSSGEVLEFANVTKRFGTLVAVSNFSARIEPGVVTGFLGPNGAGKTTSLRVLLGQTHASAGTATIGGKRYSELRQPLRHVGAVLEASELRPRRTAARHLEVTARQNQIPTSRVADVLNFVGLGDEADARVSSYSLGMKQRLSIATALLGDPGAFVLDEPANGLDPEGIRWIRLLIRRLADEGRSVLVSSHVLSEIQQIADEVLIISRGELKYGGPLDRLADPTGAPVIVDSRDREELRRVLGEAGLESEILRTGLTVRGSNASDVGAIAASAGIALTTLQQRGPTLEDAFIEIVQGTWVTPAETADDALFTDETWQEPAASVEPGETDAHEADTAGNNDLVSDAPVEPLDDGEEANVEPADDAELADDAETTADTAAADETEPTTEGEAAEPAADEIAADEPTESDEPTEPGDSAEPGDSVEPGDSAEVEDAEDTEVAEGDDAPADIAHTDAAHEDDDLIDDEIPVEAFTPVAASSSGLGALVQPKVTLRDDEAHDESQAPENDAHDVADVTNDLRDELAQLGAAAEASVDDAIEADPAPAAPVDEALVAVDVETELEENSQGEHETAADAASDDSQALPIIDGIVTAPPSTEELAAAEEAIELPLPAPAPAAPRRSRRLFGRRAAAEETPVTPVEPAEVADAWVEETASPDETVGEGETPVADAVEPAEAAAQHAEDALETDDALETEEAESTEPAEASAADEETAEAAGDVAADDASDSARDVLDAVRNLVIETGPATELIKVAPNPLGFADDATVAIETAPKTVGPLFSGLLAEDTDPTPATKAFGIPILWDRNDTVSNTVLTAAPVDAEFDDADLDVVADEVDPEEVAHIAEQVADAEIKPTRRRRRFDD